MSNEAQPLVRVLVETGYLEDFCLDRRYAFACLRDSLAHNEAPVVPSLMYGMVLDAQDPSTRSKFAALARMWVDRVDRIVCYEDRGLSGDTLDLIAQAESLGVPVERRKIELSWL